MDLGTERIDAMATPETRAMLLRDQVMKTWSPPRHCGNESPADIAQTVAMITIAYLFGRDFFTDLAENQQAAIDSGFESIRKLLDSP